MEKSRDYTIAAVKKALDILRLFGDNTSGLTLSELSALSGVGKSSMLRFLYTLANENFISYDEATKRYSLGIELYRLGMRKYNTLDVNQIAHKHLRALSDATGMICYLGVLEGDTLAMVDQLLPSRVPAWIQLVSQAGSIMELYSTGIGRLFLAQRTDQEVIRYLEKVTIRKFTEDTVTDKTALLELVRQARKDQYSGNVGENEHYVYGLCAPIYSVNGKMCAGISLCGMKDALCGGRYEEYIAAIKATALDISREIGYAGEAF